jgi:hypothetical protein
LQSVLLGAVVSSTDAAAVFATLRFTHIRRRLARTLVRGRPHGDLRGGRCVLRPLGHTPQLFAGSEVVEFHSTEELAKTMEVVEKNMEAMSQ